MSGMGIVSSYDKAFGLFTVLILSVVLFLEKYIGVGLPERIESFLKTLVTVSFLLSFPIAPVVAYADAARDWKKNFSL